MKFIRLSVLATPLLLLLATSAQAATPLTLRIKAHGSQIEFYHRGRKLSDSRLEQLCATARRQKIEIEFQRDR